MNPNDPMMQQQMGPPPKPFIPWHQPTPMAAPITIPNFFSTFEIDMLLEYFESNPDLHTAGRTGGAEPDWDPKVANNPDVRKVDILEIMPNMHKSEHLLNAANKIVHSVTQINETTFRFDIDSCMQMELAKYKDMGNYNWHTDCGPFESARMRKISFSIALSEPSDYEGGELGFFGMPPVEPPVEGEENKGFSKFKPEMGSITLFPSFATHKVFPVTSGTRYSLFGWFDGPRFR